MRKLIWVGSGAPKNMSPTKFKETVIQLATFTHGECVEFGEDNYAIIGDNEAEQRLKNLESYRKLQAIPS